MDWIPKHPGGSIWFARANGRDISAAVHTYHKTPKLMLEILKKYETKKTIEEAMDPTLNVPKFILPKNFDARTDRV